MRKPQAMDNLQVKDIQPSTNIFDKQDSEGQTVLFLACKNGMYTTVKSLIDKGANINICAKKESPLFAACRAHHTDIVALLLENGCEIDRTDSDGPFGKSALDISLSLGYKDIESLMIKAYWKHQFMYACSIKDINECKRIFGIEHDFCNEYHDGSFPLFEASKYGLTEIVMYLINYEVDLNKKTRFGQSALIAASEFGHLEIVKILVTEGADINLRDKGGKTALYKAITNDHPDIVIYLVNSGADCNLLY